MAGIIAPGPFFLGHGIGLAIGRLYKQPATCGRIKAKA